LQRQADLAAIVKRVRRLSWRGGVADNVETDTGLGQGQLDVVVNHVSGGGNDCRCLDARNRAVQQRADIGAIAVPVCDDRFEHSRGVADR
jgi:hypothetical protein